MDDDFPTFQELVEGTPALRDLLRDMMAMRGPAVMVASVLRHRP